jgi:ABC-type multidrug transport system ATPase subunit
MHASVLTPLLCPCHHPRRAQPQRNAKFKHHGKEDFVLNVPEFTCMPGELVAVCGRVGAGKSSLIQAILGNMVPVQGAATVGGKVSYVPQNPWCQNLSLRDNITFGLPFDEERYSRVSAGARAHWLVAGWHAVVCCMGLCRGSRTNSRYALLATPLAMTGSLVDTLFCWRAAPPPPPTQPQPQTIHDCALELDLQILPKGDQSKAGLRGINLSGGQRQRLNLARAAYFNGDLVLLDNALSAVDHHTAHHIFKNLLKDSLCEKATVLITHQVEFLPQCDKVAIMDQGDMLYFGPWNAQAQQLLSKVLPASHLLAAAGNAEQPKEGVPKKKSVRATSSTLSLSATNIKDNLGKKKDQPATSLTLGQGVTTWFKFARLGLHILGVTTLVWFLSAQTSRQISDMW